MTPSADYMVNYREGQAVVRIADKPCDADRRYWEFADELLVW